MPTSEILTDPEIEAASKKWDVHFTGGNFVAEVEDAFKAFQARLDHLEIRIQMLDQLNQKSPGIVYSADSAEEPKVESKSLWQRLTS